MMYGEGINNFLRSTYVAKSFLLDNSGPLKSKVESGTYSV